MRIAQLAPLAESVPPKLYGGTERVIAWLVDELVQLGYEVTLFASGDSKTKGKLHAVWPRALRLGRKGAPVKLLELARLFGFRRPQSTVLTMVVFYVFSQPRYRSFRPSHAVPLPRRAPCSPPLTQADALHAR